jgi:hypothetical protein
MTRLTLGFLVLLSAACERPSSPSPSPAAQPAAKAPERAPPAWQAGVVLDGARGVTVAELVANPTSHKDEAVRVEGTVKAVCQHRGCWVEIADAGQSIIVKSLDHGVAFPKDGVGRRMVVEGVFRIDAADSCGGGEGASAEHSGHECPKPTLLVEVRRAELAAPTAG